MRKGNGRWYRLTLIAVGNLVLWVVIAAVVGLLVSDQVDLGFETKLRQVQTTAVAAWKGLWEGKLALPGRATPRATDPSPALPSPATRQPGLAAAVTGSEPYPSPTPLPTTGGATAVPPAAEPSATDAPAASASSTAAGTLPSSTAPLPPRSEATTGAAAVGTGQGTTQSDGRPTPEPTTLLLIRPLLLADPEFHDLAALNAEMARSAPGRVVQIRYQEAMLSQEIRILCENNPDLPLRNVQVDLRRDQLILTGQTTFFGFQINARVSGTIAVRDCRPEIEIHTVTMAGILTPPIVQDQIEQQILEAMTWYPADYPLCLEQIVLEETRATIYGYRR
jgi:hypothetical protein